MPESDRPPTATLTIPEAAEFLGVPERTLRRWVAKGKLPAEEDPTSSRGRLLRLETLERYRPVAGHLRPPVRPEDRPLTATDQANGHVAGHVPTGGIPQSHPESVPSAAEFFALREQLARAEAERDAATEERNFLRGRVEAAELAATETRVLLLRSQETAQAALERLEEAEKRLALPEPTPETTETKRAWWQAPSGEQAPRPWWRFWPQ